MAGSFAFGSAAVVLQALALVILSGALALWASKYLVVAAAVMAGSGGLVVFIGSFLTQKKVP